MWSSPTSASLHRLPPLFFRHTSSRLRNPKGRRSTLTSSMAGWQPTSRLVVLPGPFLWQSLFSPQRLRTNPVFSAGPACDRWGDKRDFQGEPWIPPAEATGVGKFLLISLGDASKGIYRDASLVSSAVDKLTPRLLSGGGLSAVPTRPQEPRAK